MEGQLQISLEGRSHFRVLRAAAIALLLLLAACGTGDDPSRTATAAPDVVFTYSREGGMAGVEQEWEVHTDGTIDAPGGQELVVAAEEVRALVEMGTDSQIAAFAALPTTPDPCCDQFTYTLTFTSGGQTRTLTTTDSASEPQKISDLFARVQELIEGAEPAK